MSRYLAIGDIHGCLTAFNTLLDFVQVQPEDTMITLGDYVEFLTLPAYEQIQ